MRYVPAIRVLALLLSGVFLGSSVKASDLRPPLLAMGGPMRFISEAEGRDESSVKFWSVVANRQASQAFMDHGLGAVGLTNLIFNQDNFRVADIFADSYVPSTTESYMALLRTARIFTSASYAEKDVIFGAQWMYPVYEDRGRFGIRARIPFKYVEIIRDDLAGVPGGAQLEDVMAVQPAAAVPGGTGAAEILPNAQTQLMRFDFAEALTQSNSLNSVFDFSGKAKAGGHEICTSDPADPAVTARMRLAVVKSPAGQVPRVPDVPTNIAVALKDLTLPASYQSLPANGQSSQGTVYVFDPALGAYNTFLDSNAPDAPTRRANQLTKETLWLIPFGYEDSEGVMNSQIPGVNLGGSMNVLNSLTSRVTENVYQWMHARGYDFMTAPRQGVSDFDLDVFYQQDFLLENRLDSRNK